MGDRQWPDPRGWEALTQQEAERDAVRSLTLGELLAVVASEASENPYVGSARQKAAWDEIKRRVAVAERERDQARQALRRITSTETFTTALDLTHPTHVKTEAVIAELWARMRYAGEALAEEPQT